MEFGGTTHLVEESTKGGDHDEFNAFNGYIYICMITVISIYIYVYIYVIIYDILPLKKTGSVA